MRAIWRGTIFCQWLCTVSGQEDLQMETTDRAEKLPAMQTQSVWLRPLHELRDHPASDSFNSHTGLQTNLPRSSIKHQCCAGQWSCNFPWNGSEIIEAQCAACCTLKSTGRLLEDLKSPLWYSPLSAQLYNPQRAMCHIKETIPNMVQGKSGGTQDACITSRGGTTWTAWKTTLGEPCITEDTRLWTG